MPVRIGFRGCTLIEPAKTRSPVLRMSFRKCPLEDLKFLTNMCIRVRIRLILCARWDNLKSGWSGKGSKCTWETSRMVPNTARWLNDAYYVIFVLFLWTCPAKLSRNCSRQASIVCSHSYTTSPACGISLCFSLFVCPCNVSDLSYKQGIFIRSNGDKHVGIYAGGIAHGVAQSRAD